MDPVVMLGWFVCPTVMVTTSKAAGLEKDAILRPGLAVTGTD